MRAMSNRVAVDYDAVGSGTPVILLHGFPDTRRLWRHQVSALAEDGYRAIAPDMRGYGKSDKPADVASYSLLTVLGDVIAVLDDAGAERAHVVGHDWGAAVSWLLAAIFPDRVLSLTAMSVGHPASFRSAGLEQYARSWYMLLFQFPGIAERWLSNDDWANFRSWSGHPDADRIVAELEANRSLTPALNWYRANVPPESLLSPPVVLPPIEAPVMGVWSSRDMALCEAQMTRSASHVQGRWRYERVENAGHWLQLEVPEVVNGLLLDFLAASEART
jgi:pimeloyl-ACP methyl ester carboxylesterase